MRGMRGWRCGGTLLLGVLGVLGGVGCKSIGSAFEFLGTPFLVYNPEGGAAGPTSSGRQTGGGLGEEGATVDPCLEPQARKLLRISMRNQASEHVHYFLALIALVNGTEYPEGAVCEDDIPLYTAFGYESIPRGTTRAFGNYCVSGPALLYFHRTGQFRAAGGTGGRSLASAIGPAQGTTPTYDNAFTSAGLTVPVPNFILFHNPGTTAEGQALKVSESLQDPCNRQVVQFADPPCEQDSFYYVDETDRRAGSSALGFGSARRVPGDIQGSACQCRGLAQGYQRLASASSSASAAQCDEFFRGGRIDYVFIKDDTDPPYPQLLWRVTDSAGARAHDFDSRASIR